MEKTPNAVAVVFENQQLTYADLNRRANQLAHLQKLGVGPETLVGICMERSLEMIVGLLGILKAGGAYVPLDPDYPKGRLEFMLEDTQAPILLTQEPLIQALPAGQAQVGVPGSRLGRHCARAGYVSGDRSESRARSIHDLHFGFHRDPQRGTDHAS